MGFFQEKCCDRDACPGREVFLQMTCNCSCRTANALVGSKQDRSSNVARGICLYPTLFTCSPHLSALRSCSRHKAQRSCLDVVIVHCRELILFHRFRKEREIENIYDELVDSQFSVIVLTTIGSLSAYLQLLYPVIRNAIQSS